MKKDHLFLAVCLITCTTISSSFAKNQKLGEYASVVAGATNNTVSLIRDKYIAVSSKDEADVIKSINVSVEPKNWDVYGTFADARNGRRVIHLPIGFVLAADYFDRMYVETGMKGKLADDNSINAYRGYFFDNINVAFTKSASGEYAPPIKYYCEYMGVSAADCSAYRNATVGTYEGFKTGSLAFTIGHEIGHFVLNHVTPQQNAAHRTQYQMELEADKYAFRLMAKAGIDPGFAVAALSLFSTLVPKDIPQQNILDTARPHPVCRISLATLAAADFRRRHHTDSERNISQYEADAKRGVDTYC